MDAKAKEIIDEWGREESRQSNSRNLWQKTADLMWPYAQIMSEKTVGAQLMQDIHDMTPTLDMLDMVSGFKQVLFPSGQTFFYIKVSNRYSENETIQRYLSYLTEAVHEAIFASNFLNQIDQVLISAITFGPCGIFTEWKRGKGLNYKVPKIGSYVLLEDDSENVIGCLHKFKLSASMAYELYKDHCGPSIMKAIEKPETVQNDFWFVYKCAPRKMFSPMLSRQYKHNMPYQACIAAMQDMIVVDEGGFPENPYAFGRWMRPEFEKDGRGIGTEMLPAISKLYEVAKNFVECGEKWVNPPRQALTDSVEGEVRTGPRAITWVNQLDAVRAMDQAMNGNYPYSEKTLLFMQENIHRAFFKKAFAPLTDLTGDRRTRLEIQQRIRETLKLIGPPAGRMWREVATPSLSRSVMELIRNRQVEPPPPELAGVNFGIEYIGPLALALKSEQAEGFQTWVEVVGQANALFPEKNIGDNIDFDDAIPRIGRTLGVNIEDISTFDQREQIRQERKQLQQAQMQMQAAMAAGSAYKDASGKAEEGSPAEALMAGAG